jgi:hypothetical protein
MEVKEQAARILGRKTDIMTRDSIHKVLRARIEDSALQVFRWPGVHRPHALPTSLRLSNPDHHSDGLWSRARARYAISISLLD